MAGRCQCMTSCTSRTSTRAMYFSVGKIPLSFSFISLTVSPTVSIAPVPLPYYRNEWQDTTFAALPEHRHQNQTPRREVQGYGLGSDAEETPTYFAAILPQLGLATRGHLLIHSFTTSLLVKLTTTLTHRLTRRTGRQNGSKKQRHYL